MKQSFCSEAIMAHKTKNISKPSRETLISFGPVILSKLAATSQTLLNYSKVERRPQKCYEAKKLTPKVKQTHTSIVTKRWEWRPPFLNVLNASSKVLEVFTRGSLGWGACKGMPRSVQEWISFVKETFAKIHLKAHWIESNRRDLIWLLFSIVLDPFGHICNGPKSMWVESIKVFSPSSMREESWKDALYSDASRKPLKGYKAKIAGFKENSRRIQQKLISFPRRWC